MSGRFLPGVPGAEIESILNAAPGNEIATGKFDSPESSAALAVNAFGFFLHRELDLPPLPGCEGEDLAGALAVHRGHTSVSLERRGVIPFSIASWRRRRRSSASSRNASSRTGPGGLRH